MMRTLLATILVFLIIGFVGCGLPITVITQRNHAAPDTTIMRMQ